MNLVCWPIVLVAQKLGHVPAENHSCPWWKFAALAVMAGFQNFVNAWPQSELPGALQTVLAQLGTPILMLLSFVLLRTRYGWRHYLGAALIRAWCSVW